jgi:hypothetical protein
MEVKTCLDCLHCKVSAKSTEQCRLCYCVQKQKRVSHKESYWFTKKVCENFTDMSEEPLSVLVIQAMALKRSPPLKLGDI